MSDDELLVQLSMIAMALGGHTAKGALSHARELMDEFRMQEPDLYAARLRRQMSASLRRATNARRSG